MKFRNLCLAAALLAGPSLIASPITYFANLDGASESPANASPGVLDPPTVTIDTIANTLNVSGDVLGSAWNGHCLAYPLLHGSARLRHRGGWRTAARTFVGFPLGVTSGTYSHTYDLTLASSYNPSFITANGGTTSPAEAALAAGIAAGEAYLNIHTHGGPRRGDSRLSGPGPQPATLGFVGLALGTLLVFRLRLRVCLIRRTA